MEIKITGEAKEIAALVLAVQERQISVDEIMKQIADQLASELSSFSDEDYNNLKTVAEDHFDCSFKLS